MHNSRGKFLAHVSNGAESWMVYADQGLYRFEPSAGGPAFTVRPSELDWNTRHLLGENCKPMSRNDTRPRQTDTDTSKKTL